MHHHCRLLLPLFVCLSPFGGNSALHAQALPLARDYRVVFHNPDPERYVEGPGLVRMDDGSLVAVVPVVPREEWGKERRATQSVTQSVTHILRSGDGGQTSNSTQKLISG